MWTPSVLAVALLTGSCGRMAFDPLDAASAPADTLIDIDVADGNDAVDGAQVDPMFVQGVTVSPGPNLSVVQATLPFAQQAGDVTVLAIGWHNATTSIASVTDDALTPYQVTAFERSAGMTHHLAFGPTAAIASNTVTITFDAPAPEIIVRVVEYRGLDLTNLFENSTSLAGSSVLGASGFLNTSGPVLLVAANISQLNTVGPGPGFTSREGTGRGILEDRFAPTPGSYRGEVDLASSSPWIVQMVSLRVLP